MHVHTDVHIPKASRRGVGGGGGTLSFTSHLIQAGVSLSFKKKKKNRLVSFRSRI